MSTEKASKTAFCPQEEAFGAYVEKKCSELERLAQSLDIPTINSESLKAKLAAIALSFENVRKRKDGSAPPQVLLYPAQLDRNMEKYVYRKFQEIALRSAWPYLERQTAPSLSRSQIPEGFCLSLQPGGRCTKILHRGESTWLAVDYAADEVNRLMAERTVTLKSSSWLDNLAEGRKTRRKLIEVKTRELYRSIRKMASETATANGIWQLYTQITCLNLIENMVVLFSKSMRPDLTEDEFWANYGDEIMARILTPHPPHKKKNRPAMRRKAKNGEDGAVKKKIISQRRINARLAEAKSLPELKDIIAALLEESRKELYFSYDYRSYKIPKFGGSCPKHSFSTYNQKGIDCGIYRPGRWRQFPELISWDESYVLVKGYQGLLILERERFEECFSSILCPFCGERFVAGFECKHALMINDQVIEIWFYKNGEEVYFAYLAEHDLYRDFLEFVPQALPGVILKTCELKGPAYGGRTVVNSVWFGPDEMLAELRQRNVEQWDRQVSWRKHD